MRKSPRHSGSTHENGECDAGTGFSEHSNNNPEESADLGHLAIVNQRHLAEEPPCPRDLTTNLESNTQAG
jgi:hypothetical protein